jgi:hypothetical protein
MRKIVERKNKILAFWQENKYAINTSNRSTSCYTQATLPQEPLIADMAEHIHGQFGLRRHDNGKRRSASMWVLQSLVDLGHPKKNGGI